MFALRAIRANVHCLVQGCSQRLMLVCVESNYGKCSLFGLGLLSTSHAGQIIKAATQIISPQL